MEKGFDEKLTLDSETFSGMSRDYNFVLQRLLETMRDRDCDEGSITLNLKISLKSDYIPNYDPNIQGESREVKKPKFEHKISSSVKITDEKKGTLDTEMELVMDADTGMYVLRPIVNTQQRSFFDDDMREQFSGLEETDTEAEGEDGGTPALPGRKVLGLPGPDVIDGEFKEVAAEGAESPDSGGTGEDDISPWTVKKTLHWTLLTPYLRMERARRMERNIFHSAVMTEMTEKMMDTATKNRRTDHGR